MTEPRKPTYKDRLLRCLDAMATTDEPPLDNGFDVLRACCADIRESMDRYFDGDKETGTELLDSLEIKLGLRLDPRLEKA